LSLFKDLTLYATHCFKVKRLGFDYWVLKSVKRCLSRKGCEVWGGKYMNLDSKQMTCTLPLATQKWRHGH
jgi:hypothetical protein